MLDINQTVFMGVNGQPLQAELVAYQKSASRGKFGLYFTFGFLGVFSIFIVKMVVYSLMIDASKVVWPVIGTAIVLGTLWGATRIFRDIRCLASLNDLVEHPEYYDIRIGIFGQLNQAGENGEITRGRWTLGNETGYTPFLNSGVLTREHVSAHSPVFIAVHRQQSRPAFFVGIKRAKSLLNMNEIDTIMAEAKKEEDEKSNNPETRRT